MHRIVSNTMHVLMISHILQYTIWQSLVKYLTVGRDIQKNNYFVFIVYEKQSNKILLSTDL